MPKRDGPYIIVTQRSPKTYEVANPNNPHEALGLYHSSALRPCINKVATPVISLRKRGRPRKDNSAGSSLRMIPRNQRGSVTNGNRAPSPDRMDKCCGPPCDVGELKEIRLSIILNEKPEDLTRKDEIEWLAKNSDAIAYIKLSLADEQALQFTAEDNAKVLWDKIRATFLDQGEERKIDAGNELKHIRMKNGETVGDYIARAWGISIKCHSLGLDVSPRELVYHTVRGLNEKFSKVRHILKTERGKSMDEVLQILREEATFNLPIKTRMDGINAEAFYSRRKNEKQTRLLYLQKTKPPGK
ncbi:retrovirus-related Pol polyprotein from transposon TNT 1-94 [Trichonephila clavipes]|nr:retrovirus-related Pol polyprotein from transposon TNT 1-94 [Trichonephila clavipes]